MTVVKILLWAAAAIVLIVVAWALSYAAYYYAPKPTIDAADKPGSADFLIRNVRNRPITGIRILSIDRARILWELRSKDHERLPFRDSELRYGATPDEFEQTIPTPEYGSRSSIPPKIRQRELLIVSIEYIDDHFLAPGMGGDFGVFRKTAAGFEPVEIDRFVVGRLFARIEQIDPAATTGGRSPVSETEARSLIADATLQLAKAFLTRGNLPEGRHWRQHIRHTYPETPAAEHADELLKNSGGGVRR